VKGLLAASTRREYSRQCETALRLYELLAMSTMLYSAELWPLHVTHKQQLEAALHKYQRQTLGISWNDEDWNEEVRNENNINVNKETGTEMCLRHQLNEGPKIV